MKLCKLRDDRVNLRGQHVIVTFDGKPCRVRILTHIRGGLWMITGRELPIRFRRTDGSRRTVINETDMELVP
jgi:hypothetical protein